MVKREVDVFKEYPHKGKGNFFNCNGVPYLKIRNTRFLYKKIFVRPELKLS